MSIETINERELVLVSRCHFIEWLISAPIYFAAFYFLYYLLTSIYEYLTYPASFSEWLTALPGLTFMTLISFGLLALAFYMSGTSFVRVDREIQRISKWRGLLGIKILPKEIDIGEVSKIICRQKTQKSSNHRKSVDAHHHDRSRTFFIIDVLTTDEEQLEVIKFTSKKDAKKWGASLADFCNKPLNDRL